MAAPYWIGIDVGGTKILTGVFDSDFKLVGRAKLATDSAEGGQAVFGRIIQSADNALKEASVDPAAVKGMGLAVPGQVVPRSTVVRYAPNLGWRDFDLKPLFPAHWAFPVVIDNDVRMGTYGEWSCGAAKGSNNVFGIFAGTGIGGGLILDGKLFHGFNGHAGEVGHIIIGWKKGTELEAVAGRRNLMNRAKEVVEDSPKSIRKHWKGIDPSTFKSSQIAEQLIRGEPVVTQLIEEAARGIAAGVASVVNLLSPEVIVVGGGVTKSIGPSFPERIWELAQRWCLPRATENVRCVMAALGDDAGITGAAAYARDRFGASGAA